MRRLIEPVKHAAKILGRGGLTQSVRHSQIPFTMTTSSINKVEVSELKFTGSNFEEIKNEIYNDRPLQRTESNIPVVRVGMDSVGVVKAGDAALMTSGDLGVCSAAIYSAWKDGLYLGTVLLHRGFGPREKFLKAARLKLAQSDLDDTDITWVFVGIQHAKNTGATGDSFGADGLGADGVGDFADTKYELVGNCAALFGSKEGELEGAAEIAPKNDRGSNVACRALVLASGAVVFPKPAEQPFPQMFTDR